MNTDPRAIIDRSAMSWLQVVAVVITIGLNALDGFDVLSVSMASPGIAKEWGIDRAALGIVLSMDLIGMAVGSVFLGGLADRIGRRPTMLGCLVVMASGMYLASFATSVADLRMWRLITGLGIGSIAIAAFDPGRLCGGRLLAAVEHPAVVAASPAPLPRPGGPGCSSPESNLS